MAKLKKKLLRWDDVRTKKNGDVYCKKCGTFLGMTCDPFAPAIHEACFKHESGNGAAARFTEKK